MPSCMCLCMYAGTYVGETEGILWRILNLCKISLGETPPFGVSSEGREWGVGSVVVEFGVFGARRFSIRRSPNLENKCFGPSGLKIGAPQKRQIQPRRIQPPILGPLISDTPKMAGVLDSCLLSPSVSRGSGGK